VDADSSNSRVAMGDEMLTPASGVQLGNLSMGEINTGLWCFMLGVGRKAYGLVL
jgi:hypothetical protein